MINELIKKYQSDLISIISARDGFLDMNDEFSVERCTGKIKVYNEIINDLRKLKKKESQLFLEIRSHCTSTKQRLNKIKENNNFEEVNYLVNSSISQINNILSKIMRERDTK